MQATATARLTRRPVRPRTVALVLFAFLCLTFLLSTLLERAVSPVGDAVIANIQNHNQASVRVAQKSVQ